MSAQVDQVCGHHGHFGVLDFWEHEPSSGKTSSAGKYPNEKTLCRNSPIVKFLGLETDSLL